MTIFAWLILTVLRIVVEPLNESFQVYSKIMEIGSKLHEKKLSKEDMKAALDNLRRFYRFPLFISESCPLNCLA